MESPPFHLKIHLPYKKFLVLLPLVEYKPIELPLESRATKNILAIPFLIILIKKF
jgi:hypothetical protein